MQQIMPIRLAVQLKPHFLASKMVRELNLQLPTVVLVEVCECSIWGLSELVSVKPTFKILHKALAVLSLVKRILLPEDHGFTV